MKQTLLLLVLVFIGSAIQSQVTQINSNKSLHIHFALNNSKGLLVSEVDSTMWVTDATQAGTVQLSSTIIYKGSGGIVNGKYIFVGKTTAAGEELFITDGTVAGTTLLKDINTGSGGSFPSDFVTYNGAVYFSASTPAQGRELWKTNGTSAGTAIVKDIVAGAGSSNNRDSFHLYSNGSYMLFSAMNGAQGHELWKSDGTAAGTVFLKDINPGAGSSGIRSFSKFNNLVFFVANNGTSGAEIWKTDGTAGNTTILKDINAGPLGSVTTPFFKILNNKAYFMADNTINGQELWVTDGTTNNTTLLKDIMPGALGSFASLFNSVTVGAKFYFTAFNATNGFELWECDGSAAGTKLFKDIVAGTEGGNPFILPMYEFDLATGELLHPLFQGNKFFFMASTAAAGNELWISDGTSAGTKMVKDINAGTEDGLTNVSYLYTTTDFYFAAETATGGNELWKTNGTTAGTALVADINPGQPSSDVQLGMVVNNKMIFQATNGDNATLKDLYRLDASVVLLPVKLADFAATARGSDAIVQWTTLEELNTKDFVIERSFNGVDFGPMGTVEANGNSSDKKIYSYTDAGVLNGRNQRVFYRLMIRDKDGRYVHSEIATLKIKPGAGWTVKLAGNPVEDNIVVQLTDVQRPVMLSIKDANGKTMLTKMVSGEQQLTIPATALQPGMYMLVAETGSERKSLRFIKK